MAGPTHNFNGYVYVGEYVIAVCDCGWESEECPLSEYARNEHADHIAEVEKG